jgi:hypothetical protein
MQPEVLGKFKILFDLIGPRTRNLLACNIVPRPLRYRVPQACEPTLEY